MPSYVVLENWTEKGLREFRASPTRLDGAAAALEEVGASITSAYWTMGPYDIVSVIEAPDDETVSAHMLRDASAGNVRSITMRAFDQEEMLRIARRST